MNSGELLNHDLMRVPFSDGARRLRRFEVIGGKVQEPSEPLPLSALKRRERRAPAAFTLTELLVVLATLALLVATILPALAHNRSDALALQCLNNHKQLVLAWSVYASDFNGYLPPNEDNSNAGWLRGVLDYSLSNRDNTNTQYLLDPKFAALGRYTTTAKIYKCPADQSLSGGQRGLPRVRSISMSGCVGTKNVYPGTATTDGPWLDGFHGHTANRTWYCYGKMSDFIHPGPAATWVFIDENPDSVNDAGFAVAMAVVNWVDLPSTLHDHAGSFAYADGHAEMHKWITQTLPETSFRFLLSAPTPVAQDPRDLKWVQDHTSAKVVK